MGLVYLPSIVMVGYYFEEKRAIATGIDRDVFSSLTRSDSFVGIVTAGTGIGSVTFGPLSRYLFNALGWKYGLLILAAILLLCAVCSAFMVPLKPERVPRMKATTEA